MSGKSSECEANVERRGSGRSHTIFHRVRTHSHKGMEKLCVERVESVFVGVFTLSQCGYLSVVVRVLFIQSHNRLKVSLYRNRPHSWARITRVWATAKMNSEKNTSRDLNWVCFTSENSLVLRCVWLLLFGSACSWWYSMFVSLYIRLHYTILLLFLIHSLLSCLYSIVCAAAASSQCCVSPSQQQCWCVLARYIFLLYIFLLICCLPFSFAILLFRYIPLKLLLYQSSQFLIFVLRLYVWRDESELWCDVIFYWGEHSQPQSSPKPCEWEKLLQWRKREREK